MKYVLMLTLLLISLACAAGIYMHTDSNANTVYSDTPSNNSQAVSLPGPNNTVISTPAKNTVTTTVEQTETTTGATAPGQEPTANQGYNAFIMTDPTDQETFQNQQDIPVTVKIDPSLREGDKVQLYLDGAPIGAPTGDLRQLIIHQADRGQHQLYASLIDSTGTTQKETDAITIFIHYSAIPTGSGAIAPVQTGGVTPSSPGSGITPEGNGSGITPPNGNGITPSGGGNGITPSASQGSGITPPPRIGPTP